MLFHLHYANSDHFINTNEIHHISAVESELKMFGAEGAKYLIYMNGYKYDHICEIDSAGAGSSEHRIDWDFVFPIYDEKILLKILEAIN